MPEYSDDVITVGDIFLPMAIRIVTTITYWRKTSGTAFVSV